MAFVVAALAAAVLSGTITDRTTGQPLAGVRIHVGKATATTSSDGRYALHGLTPGDYTFLLESRDVPPEHLRVRLRRGVNQRNVRVCSTTLDYGCGQAPVPISAPNG